jgi:hypothetical protein
MLKEIENKCRADFDILVDSFVEDVDIRTLSALPMISIYFNPKDFPGKYVARVFDIRPGAVHVTRYIMINESLEKMRSSIPAGFSCMNRTTEDDPELLEVWF